MKKKELFDVRFRIKGCKHFTDVLTHSKQPVSGSSPAVADVDRFPGFPDRKPPPDTFSITSLLKLQKGLRQVQKKT